MGNIIECIANNWDSDWFRNVDCSIGNRSHGIQIAVYSQQNDSTMRYPTLTLDPKRNSVMQRLVPS